MRALAFIFGIAAFAVSPVSAQNTPTGVNGYIVNVDTHRPIAGADVSIYRMPIQALSQPLSTMRSDKHGYFSNILLPPGRYIVMATALDSRSGCEISDLYDGAISRIRIEISSKGENCVGKNVRTALVMPGQGSSVYIIHE
jgi:hypothetical protein